MTEFWASAKQRLEFIQPIHREGVVLDLVGLILQVQLPGALVGEICRIYPKRKDIEFLHAKVVGFRENNALLMVLGSSVGVHSGCRVMATGLTTSVQVSPLMLGRLLDGAGLPLDELPVISGGIAVSAHPTPLAPLQRAEINQVFSTGIKAIDALLTLGKGQRMGLFANAGVGKSSLLNSICLHRAGQGDLIVLALIGERGREVRECYQQLKQSGALHRTVIIAATAEQPALLRIQALYTALAIAEYFSAQQQDVTLVVDSMTRFAMALRDVGLAIGEAPTLRGYTSSVFSVLPEVIERCGAFESRGAITGLFSVLVEGELQQDPAADAMKAVLDGHLVLSAQLAEKEHYPAIDVLKSVSRLFSQLATPQQRQHSRKLRQVWSRFEEQKHMLAMGLGESESANMLKADMQKINSFVMQDLAELHDHGVSVAALEQLGLETII